MNIDNFDKYKQSGFKEYNHSNNSKKYLEVYENVREDIIGGRYEVGSKLPSKRVMAEAMGVSVITVEHAYELLAEEGYIVPRQKSGYFVSFDDREIYVGAKKTIRSEDTFAKRISGEKNFIQNDQSNSNPKSDAPAF